MIKTCLPLALILTAKVSLINRNNHELVKTIKLTFSVSLMSASTSKAFYDLASGHGGYFTTREALQAGLSYRQMSYHLTWLTIGRS